MAQCVSDDFIIIGKVVKPQGVKGQLKIRPITDDPGRFLALKSVYLSDDDTPVRVLSCDVRDEFVYLSLDGINTRDEAESLRARYLRVRREDASELPEGRYFITDLIGCEVRDENGTSLGELKEILQHGAADVYVVSGVQNFSFPAVKQVIREVDITAKVITVDGEELNKVILYED